MWILLLGCPFVSSQDYAERVQDVDGDGLVALRFGGRDCNDRDPELGDCDADRDGVTSLVSGGTDCDDSKASVHPDAQEHCDGIDNDCDGRIDDDDPAVLGRSTFFLDLDQDGHGSGPAVLACTQPEGHSPLSGDCNDTFPSIHPGVPERCDDVDWNCDGTALDDAIEEWFADEDGDGFGDPGAPLSTGCDAPHGGVSNPFDCDDTDPLAHPTGLTSPDSTERCDGIDNDCDGLFDGDDPSLAAAESTQMYRDEDGDGFGAPLAEAQRCASDEGYVTNALDCDDADPLGRPSAPPALAYVEICDGFDNDCNGQIDAEDPALELASAFVLHPDIDQDGFGDTYSTATVACVQLPGLVSDASDCDDDDASVRPGGQEVCGGGDEDCDGLTDSADPDNDGTIWYPDDDGDGIGIEGGARAVCEADGLPGFAPVAGDCNNADAGITSEVAWYLDSDGDGHGDVHDTAPVQNCFPQAGRAPLGDDCDDTNPLVNPAIVEVCNDLDDNCDGSADEGALGSAQGYRDADGDGYGAGGFGTFCAGVANNPDDCDDTNAATRPFAIEVCDGDDNDCDGMTDDEDPGLETSGFFPDEDFDGFGYSGPPGEDYGVYTCARPPTYVANNRDCNDENSAEYFSLYKIDPNAPAQSWFRPTIGAGLGNDGLCEGTPVVMVLVAGDHVFPNDLQIDAGMIVRGEDGARVLLPDEGPRVSSLLRFENVELVPAGGALVHAEPGAVVEWVDVRITDAHLSGPLVQGSGSVTMRNVRLENLGIEGPLIDVVGGVQLEEMRVQDLVATGGRALFELDGPVTIENSVLRRMQVPRGLWRVQGGSVQMERTQVEDADLGGPVFCMDCTLGTGGSEESTTGATGSLWIEHSAFDSVTAAGPWLLWSDEGITVTSIGNTFADDHAAPAMVRLRGDSERDAWTSLRDRFVRVAGGFEVLAADLRFHESQFIGTNWSGPRSEQGQVAMVNTAFVASHLQVDAADLDLRSNVIASGVWPFPAGVDQDDSFHFPEVDASGQDSTELDPSFGMISWHPDLPLHRRIPYPRASTAFTYGNQLQSLSGELDGGSSWFVDPNSDQLTAAWLLFHGSTPECLHVLPALLEPAGDPDHDGLDNVHEWYAGSWPCIADTDEDGVPDGEDLEPLNPTQ